MATNLMGSAFANALLANHFGNSAIATVGDATGIRGSSTAGSFFIGLHTACPVSTQDSFEFADTDYVRQPVARSLSTGWDATTTPDGSDQVSVANKDPIVFEQVADTEATITHVSIGAEVSGATLLVYVCELDTPLGTVIGEIPQIEAGALKVAITVNNP